MTLLTNLTYILIGVSAYIAFISLRVGVLSKKLNKIPLTFSALSGAAILLAACHIALAGGANSILHELTLIVSLALFSGALVAATLFRFVALYTAGHPSDKLLNFGYFLSAVLVSTAGYTLFDSELLAKGATPIEVKTFLGNISVLKIEFTWVYFLNRGTLAVLLLFIMYRILVKSKERSAKIMAAAVSFYVLCVISDMMLFNGVWDAPPLTALGVLFLIAVVGLVLDYERIRDTWNSSNYDALTGLPNREHTYSILKHVISTGRSDCLVGLMFIDLDRFKEVNDALGHHVGDKLLKKASERMLSCVRTTDTVGRLGGDEFVIILYDLDSEQGVVKVCDKILKALAETFVLDKETAHVSASIGVTIHPKDAIDIPTLFKNADQAMYEAKRLGRNRYVFYDKGLQATSFRRSVLIQDLPIGILNNQFYLVYQPIVNLISGEAYKAEALIRWNHPTLGLISPAEFIPLAEETGDIIKLGDFIFEQAIMQCVAWRKELPHFRVSVNTSPIQFRSLETGSFNLFHFLEKHGLPGEALIIEITESTLMTNTDTVSKRFNSIKGHGSQLALDDFGTGYSSLSYLKKFPVDIVKIDQSFVRNLTAGSADAAMCEAIIVMTHKLGMKVTAEGIENSGQLSLLRDLGCDFGQGYLFSRPVHAKELTISGKSFDLSF